MAKTGTVELKRITQGNIQGQVMYKCNSTMFANELVKKQMKIAPLINELFTNQMEVVLLILDNFF